MQQKESRLHSIFGGSWSKLAMRVVVVLMVGGERRVGPYTCVGTLMSLGEGPTRQLPRNHENDHHAHRQLFQEPPKIECKRDSFCCMLLVKCAT